MEGKRQAETQLTKQGLLYEEMEKNEAVLKIIESMNEDDEDLEQLGTADNSADQANRKFIKVKRTLKVEKPVIAEEQKVEEVKQEEKPQEVPAQKEEPQKEEEINPVQEAKPALVFGGTTESNKFAASFGGGNIQPVAPATSIFGTTSLFGKAAEIKPAAQPGSVFGTNQTPLFGGTSSGFSFGAPLQASTEGAAAPSIFGNSSPPAFKFANASPFSGSSVFGSGAPSIASLTKNPSASNNNQEHGDYEEQGSGDELYKSDGEGEDKEAATKPVKLTIQSRPPEKSPYEKVFSVGVEKFKKLLKTKKQNNQFNSKTMGRGTLSIEKATINEKPFYMCVFRNALGNTLYSGKIDAKHSVNKIIPEKANKNQLKVRFLSPKPDPETKKFVLEDCVISFARLDDLHTYKRQFDQAIATLKSD